MGSTCLLKIPHRGRSAVVVPTVPSEPWRGQTLRLLSQWLDADTALITAEGSVDAANADAPWRVRYCGVVARRDEHGPRSESTGILWHSRLFGTEGGQRTQRRQPWCSPGHGAKSAPSPGCCESAIPPGACRPSAPSMRRWQRCRASRNRVGARRAVAAAPTSFASYSAVRRHSHCRSPFGSGYALGWHRCRRTAPRTAEPFPRGMASVWWRARSSWRSSTRRSSRRPSR